MTEQSILPDENDKERITVNSWESFDDLMTSGNAIEANDGTMYYHLPFWFKKAPGGSGWYLYHFNDLPDGLVEAIIKARLGGENPKPDQPLIEYPYKPES